MNPTRMTHAALIALFTMAASTGCSDSLLGGRCLDGYVRHGHDCVGNLVLLDGSDGVTADAGDTGSEAEDGSNRVDDAPGTDTTASTSDGNDVGLSSDVADAEVARCFAGYQRCGDNCVDTSSDHENCGACGAACAASDVCSTGACTPLCGPGLTACGGDCVDLNTSATNCGGCGIVCHSGICNGGLCRDARAGHLVVIGHDYSQSLRDQDRVLANAIALSGNLPSRVLTVDTYADFDRAVGNANAAIDRGASGRSWTHVALADPAEISSTLTIDRFDALLVYEQVHATPDEIDRLAGLFGDSLASFIQAGGVVVVLESGSSGTYRIANGTGFLTIRDATPTSGDVAHLMRPIDALAVGVSAAYLVLADSAWFSTDGDSAVFAVADGPVVLHRAVAP